MDLTPYKHVIIDRRAAGDTWTEVTEAVSIARGIQTSTFSVFRFSADNGLHKPHPYKTLPKSEKPPRPPRPLTEREHDMLRRFDANESLEAIAKVHGLTRERVRQIVLPHRTSRNQTARARRAERIAEFTRLVDAGKTAKQIAEIMGVSAAYVNYLNTFAKLDVSRMTIEERLEMLRLAAKVANGRSIRSVARGDHALAVKLGYFCEKEGIKSRHGRWRDFSGRDAVIRKARAKGLTWAKVAAVVAETEGRSISEGVIKQYVSRRGLR